MKNGFEDAGADAKPTRWWALALAWWFLYSPVLWMWPGQRALVDATVSALLFSPLFLARPLLRAALPLLLLAGTAQLAYFLAVHSEVDEFFWITVLGTQASESWEYLQSYRWQDAGWLLAWLAVALACAVYLWRHAPAAVQRRSVRAALLALLAPWLLWVGASAAKSNSPAEAVRKIDRIYPMRLPESYLHYAGTAAHLHTVPAIAPPTQPAKADVGVVVIGESASAARWSLLGYGGADTNAALRPLLPSLAVLRVLANGNNTAKTVPVLLSGKSLVAKRGQPEPASQGHFVTYLDQARQAGFQVASLSNQGAGSGNESFFHIAFRQRSDRFAKLPEGQWDGALTPLLEQVLQSAAAEQPLLLTLHTYGSHPQLTKRYPPDQAPFADAYDNSIAYSSSLLAQWIARLEQLQERRVVLLYISDHGLNLPACGGQYTHGYARSAYEVPMLVWANQRFQQAQPQWLAQVQATAAEAAKTADGAMAYDNRVFQATVADVLGYAAAYPSAAAVPMTALPERRIDGKPYAQMYPDNQCTPF